MRVIARNTKTYGLNMAIELYAKYDQYVSVQTVCRLTENIGRLQFCGLLRTYFFKFELHVRFQCFRNLTSQPVLLMSPQNCLDINVLCYSSFVYSSTFKRRLYVFVFLATILKTFFFLEKKKKKKF